MLLFPIAKDSPQLRCENSKNANAKCRDTTEMERGIFGIYEFCGLHFLDRLFLYHTRMSVAACNMVVIWLKCSENRWWAPLPSNDPGIVLHRLRVPD